MLDETQQKTIKKSSLYFLHETYAINPKHRFQILIEIVRYFVSEFHRKSLR